MSGSILALLELLLVFGLLLGFGIWQLRSVRKKPEPKRPDEDPPER